MFSSWAPISALVLGAVSYTHLDVYKRQAQDISEQLRGELAGMTGSMSCRILVELDDPEGAEVGAGGAPVSSATEASIREEFERRRHPAEDGAQEDGSAPVSYTHLDVYKRKPPQTSEYGRNPAA